MGKKRKKKKVLLSGSDPFYLSKKLRRRRYGEVSAQTSQKSQNRALVKKKVAYRAPAAQACTPPTWTINRIFSKSEILAESLNNLPKKKKKKEKKRKKRPKKNARLLLKLTPPRVPPIPHPPLPPSPLFFPSTRRQPWKGLFNGICI